MQGEKKMKELLVIVDNMEREINRNTDPYDFYSPRGCSSAQEDINQRLRTGSISRSRSSSVMDKRPSRHGSFCQ